MHKEDSIIAFVETLGGGPRRSRLSVSRVMGQETVSHPCLGMDHLQWTCSGVEVDFAVDFFAENPHLARVCSDDVNLAGGLTDFFRSRRSGMVRPLPSQGNTPYQSIPFRTNTSYGVTAFGPFRLAEMSRPSPRQEKRRDRLSPYPSSTCPASRRLTPFLLCQRLGGFGVGVGGAAHAAADHARSGRFPDCRQKTGYVTAPTIGRQTMEIDRPGCAFLLRSN
jgi:hypothetical protein